MSWEREDKLDTNQSYNTLLAYVKSLFATPAQPEGRKHWRKGDGTEGRREDSGPWSKVKCWCGVC